VLCLQNIVGYYKSRRNAEARPSVLDRAVHAGLVSYYKDRYRIDRCVRFAAVVGLVA
jgi:hypothetical protein